MKYRQGSYIVRLLNLHLILCIFLF